MTGKLHLQIHPSAVKEIIIQPISESLSSGRKDVLFSKGAHLKDLKEVRELIYRLQRPGIAPNLVYAHDWKEKDFCLFHNQASCEAVLQIPTYWRHKGVLHSVVGSFKKEEVRVFHQCNLAASTDPIGPSLEDTHIYV